MLHTHDDDELIDAASGCAQFRPLLRGDDAEDESLRECIKINVCRPLRERIAELERERDSLASIIDTKAEWVFDRASVKLEARKAALMEAAAKFAMFSESSVNELKVTRGGSDYVSFLLRRMAEEK